MYSSGYTLNVIMKCPQCGSDNPQNANFCMNCGTSFSGIAIPEKRNVTVLFADLVNFTRISENKDPEDVLNMLNSIFQVFEKIVYEYDGTIDKYLGDGVMILFGAPVTHEDDSERAMRCAIEIVTSVHKIREELNEDIKIKVSINSGYVISGYTGGTRKKMYTVIGDTVNVAEKINELASPSSIVVTENIYKETNGSFEFRKLGNYVIPGREGPIMLYEFLKPKYEKYVPSTIKGKLVPLVGRQKELSTLINFLHSSLNGEGRIVAVIGEAGVGKSRMKYEIKNYCNAYLDLLILEADCRSQDKEAIYAPFIEILNTFFDIKPYDDKETRRNKVTKIIEDLNVTEDISSVIKNLLGLETELKPKEKIEVYKAVSEILKLASKKKPIFIIIEDLHWVDDASIELLKFLLEKIKEMRMFLLLTYRPSPKISLPDLPHFETISLPNLSKEECIELIKNLLEVKDVPRELSDLIYQRTEGNPLFIEELTEMLYKEEFLQVQNGAIVICNNLDSASIPDKIINLFLQEIDRLPPDTKHVAKVASVIGREFSKLILREVIQEENLEIHLRRLEESGLAFKDKVKEDYYVFKHSFVRDAASSLLPKKEQKELHAKIGECFEKVYKDRIEDFYETIAFHFELGGNYPKAFLYNYKLGLKFTSIGMYSPGYSRLKKAEDILKNVTKEEFNTISIEDLYTLYISTAKVLYKMGQLAEALPKLDQALDIAFRISDTSKLKECHKLKIEIQYTLGDLESTELSLESVRSYIDKFFYELIKFKLSAESGLIEPEKTSIQALNRVLKGNDNPIESVELVNSYLNMLYTFSQKEKFVPILKILDELEKQVQQELMADFKLHKVHSYIICRNFERAKNEVETLRLLVKREYNEEKYARLLIADSILKREEGEYAEAQQLLNFAKSVSEKIPNSYIKAISLLELGKLSLYYLGERINSIQYFNNALETFQGTGEMRYVELCKIHLWQSNLIIGNPIQYEHLPHPLKLKTPQKSARVSSCIKVLNALVNLLCGNINDALSSLRKTNYFYCDSELLILLAYTLLLLPLYLDVNDLLIEFDKTMSVLSNRTESLLEYAHYYTIGILHSLLTGNYDKGISIMKQEGTNPKMRALRESAIICEVAPILLDPERDRNDKAEAIEESLTQLEIARFSILTTLLQTIQFKLIEPFEIPIKTDKLHQLQETLRKFKFRNLLSSVENLNRELN